jgi:hypothetical protein
LRDAPDRFRGTFAPFSRASDKPIAIACLRLFTFRPEPLFSVPFFRRRIALSTFFPAPLLYLAIPFLRWKATGLRPMGQGLFQGSAPWRWVFALGPS